MAGKAVEITDANFEDTILNAGKPALVDFWAVWCGPCRVIGPIVEELAEEYGDRVVVGKLDVDANRDTAVKYGIQAIPTLLLVNNGEIADRIVTVSDYSRQQILEAFPAGTVPPVEEVTLRTAAEMEPYLREPLSEGWKPVYALPRIGQGSNS